MAALTGKGGTVLWADGNQWRTFAAGLSGWTGSLDGVGFDATSTGQGNLIAESLLPVSAAVVLELDQTQGGKLTGTAFVSSASYGAEIDGMANASWSLQGSGSVAYTTST